MKRKKSRHKAVAINFLSNISLDGNHNSTQLLNQEVQKNRLSGNWCTDEDRGVNKLSQLRQSQLILHSAVSRENFFHETDASCSVAFADLHRENVEETIASLNHDHNCLSENHYVSSNRKNSTLEPFRLLHVSTDVTSSNDTLALPNEASPRLATRAATLATADPSARSIPDRFDRKQKQNLDVVIHDRVALKPRSRLISTSDTTFVSVSKRCLIRCFGLLKPTVALSSIIPYDRKDASIFSNRAVQRACHHVSTNTIPRSPADLTEIGTNLVRNAKDLDLSLVCTCPTLSSLRPTGETVVSYAHFLQPRRFVIPSRRASRLPYRHLNDEQIARSSIFSSISNKTLDYNIGADDGTVFSTIYGKEQLIDTTFAFQWQSVTPSTSFNSHHLQRLRPVNLCLPTDISSHDFSSAVDVDIYYPDPLISYQPNLLDDPGLLVATGKRVLQLSHYLTSVLEYIRPDEQKRTVNQVFRERFPAIQLTLTKLRSIKSTLVRVSQKLHLDLWITSHAHVLFEKLVLKLFIQKSNRRLCASACLLISAKINDIKRAELITLIQELENQFRFSRRDLLQTELDVTLGLEFCLIPADSEIIPHYLRIHKSLDMPPSSLTAYSISVPKQHNHHLEKLMAR